MVTGRHWSSKLRPSINGPGLLTSIFAYHAVDAVDLVYHLIVQLWYVDTQPGGKKKYVGQFPQ